MNKVVISLFALSFAAGASAWGSALFSPVRLKNPSEAANLKADGPKNASPARPASRPVSRPLPKPMPMPVVDPLPTAPKPMPTPSVDTLPAVIEPMPAPAPAPTPKQQPATPDVIELDPVIPPASVVSAETASSPQNQARENPPAPTVEVRPKEQSKTQGKETPSASPGLASIRFAQGKEELDDKQMATLSAAWNSVNTKGEYMLRLTAYYGDDGRNASFSRLLNARKYLMDMGAPASSVMILTREDSDGTKKDSLEMSLIED